MTMEDSTAEVRTVIAFGHTSYLEVLSTLYKGEWTWLIVILTSKYYFIFNFCYFIDTAQTGAFIASS